MSPHDRGVRVSDVMPACANAYYSNHVILPRAHFASPTRHSEAKPKNRRTLAAPLKGRKTPRVLVPSPWERGRGVGNILNHVILSRAERACRRIAALLLPLLGEVPELARGKGF